MSDLTAELKNYLSTVAGQDVEFVEEKIDDLPLFLRERYRIGSVQMFDLTLHFAVEKAKWEPGSPKEYGKHFDLINAALKCPPTLVLPAMPAYVRTRMIQANIPFVVPGLQMFLPHVMLDLREKYPRPGTMKITRLTPVAQSILLHHLLRKTLTFVVEGRSLRQLANHLGYSPMMITRARTELEAAGLCSASREGRALTLTFTGAGRELWERARPLLQSPVKKTHWINYERMEPMPLVAGISALSCYSMIAEDELPTFAMPRQLFKEWIEGGKIDACPGPEEARAKMEVWSYNPRNLSESNVVDCLSLHLSLADSADERVQHAAAGLLEEPKW